MQEDTAFIFNKYGDMMKYEPEIDEDSRLFESLTWSKYDGVSLEEHLTDER